MRDPAIVVQGRVVGALMLRDVQTRFGGNPANYLIAVAWPLVHIAVLLAVYSAAGRAAPYGSSSLQFFATGVLPYILFNYPARFILTALMMNAPLLAFPVVTMFDILLARIALELTTAFAVVGVTAATLWSLGVDIVPADPIDALAAMATTLLMATGFGMFNAIIAKKVVGWAVAFVLFSIVMYMLSGVLFVPDALPEWVRGPLSWNPLLQAISWFRAAYYPGYGQLHLDRTYFVLTAVGIFTAALIVERFSRRWILS